jgi:hypothetical protein
MSEAKHAAGKFRTSVPGIGPYCVEFPDGEIVSTRSEERQDIIANAEQVKADRKALLTALRMAQKEIVEVAKNIPANWDGFLAISDAIDQAEKHQPVAKKEIG